MSERTLLDLSDEEFNTLIEQYIERGTQETDDIDADLFFDALADFMDGPAETTIELEGQWQEGYLSLSPESPVPPEVMVYDNLPIPVLSLSFG